MNAKQTIRSIRTERGISQETLAELLEVSRQTISKWENGQGRPSADSVAKLSEVFGIPAEAFLRDDWVPPAEKPPEIQVVEVPWRSRLKSPWRSPGPEIIACWPCWPLWFWRLVFSLARSFSGSGPRTLFQNQPWKVR